MSNSFPSAPIPRPGEVGKVPRIGLQLDKTGSYRQCVAPDFIHRLIEYADPDLQLESVISPLLSRRSTTQLTRLQDRAAKNDPSYQKVDFENWYEVRFEPPKSFQITEPGFDFSNHNGNAEEDAGAGEHDYTIHPRFVRLIHRLHAHPSVLSVHFIGDLPPPGIHHTQHPQPPLAVTRSSNPLNTKQDYLDAAPNGVDAAAAWARPGGDGTGVTVLDIESGWNLQHEDLVAANLQIAYGDNWSQKIHGTMTLGPIFMADNQVGGVGIAPRTRGLMIGTHSNAVGNNAEAILQATLRSAKGDIILIELQEYDPVSGAYLYPVEVVDINYQMIRLATSLGITVIEPSCNGYFNLDDYVSLSLSRIFNRTHPSFRDSGAIMVGASDKEQPPPRADFANQGSRIDVFAHGESVLTTSTDASGTIDNWYSEHFSGTSSAAAIVTGVAAAMQGIVYARWGLKLKPESMRQGICYGGTPSADPATDLIGVMPNLGAIVTWIDAL